MVANLEQRFFKGVDGYMADANSETARLIAEKSVYYWWWQFARINPVLWYARTANADPIDPRTRSVLKLMGDLSFPYFEDWWSANGFSNFSEPRNLVAVNEIDPASSPIPYKDAKTLHLQVSMIVNRETIIKEFEELLDRYHPGRHLDPASFSQAKLRLYTTRYNVDSLANSFKCYIYSEIFPKLPKWVIADRLGLSTSTRVRDADGALESGLSDVKRAVALLRSKAVRAIDNANLLMNNLTIGDFPANVIGEYEKYPFGTGSSGREFRAATEAKDNPWREWLKLEYLPYLHNSVQQCARRFNDGAEGPMRGHNLVMFVSGESNRW